MSYTPHSLPSAQRGTVLFVALIFMVLITLLGLTASSTSVLQERMTGGMRNSQLSLMGAESTVRSVEWMIWNKSNSTPSTLQCGGNGDNDFCYTPNTNTGVLAINSLVPTFRKLQGWPSSTAGDGATPYTTTTLTGLSGTQATAKLSQQPRYLIEDLGQIKSGTHTDADATQPNIIQIDMFRITARATGGNSGSVRTAESYFVAQTP